MYLFWRGFFGAGNVLGKQGLIHAYPLAQAFCIELTIICKDLLQVKGQQDIVLFDGL